MVGHKVHDLPPLEEYRFINRVRKTEIRPYNCSYYSLGGIIPCYYLCDSHPKEKMGYLLIDKGFIPKTRDNPFPWDKLSFSIIPCFGIRDSFIQVGESICLPPKEKITEEEGNWQAGPPKREWGYLFLNRYRKVALVCFKPIKVWFLPPALSLEWPLSQEIELESLVLKQWDYTWKKKNGCILFIPGKRDPRRIIPQHLKGAGPLPLSKNSQGTFLLLESYSKRLQLRKKCKKRDYPRDKRGYMKGIISNVIPHLV